MNTLQPPRVLILPGWQNSGPDHWQSRWEQRYGYTRVQQHDWQRPLRGDWSIQLQEAVLDSDREVVLVAHSLGCILTAWWAAHSPLAQTKVRAALLVAPGDVEQGDVRQMLPGWSPVMLQRLPFPSVLVGSDNDPYCTQARAQQMAQAWGANYVNLGPVGHINTDSGLGDWNEGHALLQSLMKE
ncbi:MAG: serine hydrolase family protein [Comamonas sp.]|nr:serine hydrolase family protein [Candidatus Comamonas equi]